MDNIPSVQIKTQFDYEYKVIIYFAVIMYKNIDFFCYKNKNIIFNIKLEMLGDKNFFGLKVTTSILNM